MPEFDIDAALAGSGEPVWSGHLKWSRKDSQAACQQGWDIFSSDCEEGTELQIQALTGGDDYPVTFPFDDDFSPDGKAWTHVWEARHHDRLCLKALAILKRDSPVEYQRIRTFVGA